MSTHSAHDVAQLSLYHYDSCFYCSRVRRAIAELGLDIELRDVLLDREHRKDLVAATGRGTVPVLRIRYADDREVWMPESRDIIAFLQRNFGL